jgi:hypothetical protein
MLILSTSPESITGQPAFPKSHGLQIQIRHRGTDPPATEVELVLTDQQYRDIFDQLIEDLVETAEQPDDEKTGISRFITRLSDWQRLLTRLTLGILSKENQQGLWGELWVLRDVVGPAVGFAIALNSWQGPFRSDHDFQLQGSALEVKTSSSHIIRSLMISSERQLDYPLDISLALIALSVDSRPNHGETLPEIVQSVRSVASGLDYLPVFEERLIRYGYQDEDAEYYSKVGYTIRSRKQFGISPGFPRITPSDLMPGVSEVSYSITVTACSQYEINDTELINLLKGGS